MPIPRRTNISECMPSICPVQAVKIARMTRPKDVLAPDVVKEFVAWGAGPRASQYLVLGAKARAAKAVKTLKEVRKVITIAAAAVGLAAAIASKDPDAIAKNAKAVLDAATA